MEKGLMLKYMKSNYKCDDFGSGKSRLHKNQIRRIIKKIAKRQFNKDMSL